ncbi:Mus81p KNAG_0C04660 [Huiozyma naganishii CBS 8797]|uniref:Crossover junction endonuclease MUS81 n=1 Tax=Huiozyma naganishii (strain ATCC MYA-139 / BCRC 22969 / CBS 8797 / KCTC 17520 / NBRC 10181 / NCYC 3082 / Yp74L-3) TaxID=1071383 RepID=J7RJ72_HUIN7|nr:hypothetical protein KNAG_0C04660 [Kazachstania naganishii CBS 8797]CCK69568.1 hypothetical protein KNAG_0C04660 [Kazachstania naganishii CBS 8797]
MSLPSDLKDLYLKLLKDLQDSLSSKQQQLSLTYQKAHKNLQQAEGVFYYIRDLKKVKGIGDTIIKRLEAKLNEHCKQLNIEPPPASKPKETSSKTKRSRTQLRTDDTEQDGQKKKPKRRYIPKRRSGGYAIMLALLELRAVNRAVSKEDIIDVGQKYSDSSMVPNHSTKEFYGAWSSIASLKNHNLVEEEGRPKRYFLTDPGVELAKMLQAADDIAMKKIDEGTTTKGKDSFFEEPEETANLSDLIKAHSQIQIKNRDKSSMSFLDTTFQTTSTPRGSKLAAPSVSSNTDLREAENELFSSSHERNPRKKFEGVSYELWTKDSYEIYPIVDRREIKSQTDRDFFAKALARKGLKTDIRQLSLGDIIWVAKNKKTGCLCILNTIIERKRLDDLALSIRDNRFMEQKNRLENSGCAHKYYLIEETMGGSVGNMGEALRTSLWVILTYYMFGVIRTANSEQTVEKLNALHCVIERFYADKELLVIFPKTVNNKVEYKQLLTRFQLEFSKKSNIECCHTFECFQEIMSKNELRTVAELTIQILLYVKGVSLEKAIAIQSVFPTLNHLLTAYRNCKSELEAKKLLYHKLGNIPGNKKITKNLSERIADVFSTI